MLLLLLTTDAVAATESDGNNEACHFSRTAFDNEDYCSSKTLLMSFL